MFLTRIFSHCIALALLSSLAFGESEKHLYLVARPITVEARLGTTAKVAYHVLPAVDSVVKVGLLYASAGQPLAALALGVFEGSKSILSTRLYSSLDLKARAWYGRRAPLKMLKETPGVERLIMLSAAEFRYQGIAPNQVVARSFIFLESSERLDLKQAWTEELGELVEVTDIEATHVRMRLTIDGDHDPLTWDTSLHDIFEHASMPEAVSHSWVVALAAHDAVQSLSKRHLTKAHEEVVGVNATLIFSNGVEQELGTVMQAGNLRKLLGQGLRIRAKTMWRSFWGMPAGPKGDFPFSSIKCQKLLTNP